MQTIKDMVFPVFCLGCKKEGTWCCVDCLSQIDVSGVMHCPVCHAEQPYGSCCGACRAYSSIDGHLALTQYEHGNLISRLIEALKYQYVTDIVTVLEPSIRLFCEEQASFLASFDVILPVPLHARRYAERGFNQAAVLGSVFAQVLDIPLYDIVQRRLYTTQQAKLAKEQREENMSAAFVLPLDYIDMITHQHILLIDDVYTTGSTLQAVAKVLQTAEPESIVGITLARGG